MIFNETKLKGAYFIQVEPFEDDRGLFARMFCRAEFQTRGLNPSVAQCNVSLNRTKGTLRGMHYQIAPHAEAKLVTCLTGSIYDVIIDLRPDSPTRCQWVARELNARYPRTLIYIPEGFAHGFQTLKDDTEVFYQMSYPYVPDAARGVRWDDPVFAIQWPKGPRTLSERYKNYPDYSPTV